MNEGVREKKKKKRKRKIEKKKRKRKIERKKREEGNTMLGQVVCVNMDPIHVSVHSFLSFTSRFEMRWD